MTTRTPGPDIAGALVAAARKLGGTTSPAPGPRGTVKVTWTGHQPVTVPGLPDPGARSAAVAPMARLAAAAALGDHETPEALDTTARLVRHLLTPAAVPDAPEAPADPATRRLVAAAAEQVVSHCEKVLAGLPPPPAALIRSGAGTAQPEKQKKTRPDREPPQPAAETPRQQPPEPPPTTADGQLFARPADPETSRKLRERIWQVNEAAAAWYRKQMTPQSWAYRYMTSERGFGEEVLDAFEIGFAPRGPDSLTGYLSTLTDDSGTRIYSDDLLADAGLARRADDGTLTDRFRNRTIFPIRDHEGHLAGFGARKHPRNQNKKNPKYLNTPETVAYRKGQILYGLWQSRHALSKGCPPVILEGYTDVLATWCVGGYAPVAPLGTAFSGQQATALAARGRLHEHVPVLIARDPDPAGLRAAAHDIGVLTPRHTLDARYIPLAEDPADTWRHHGDAALRAVLDAHVPAADLLTDTVLARYEGRLPRRDSDFSSILACRDVARALGPAENAVRRLGPSGIRRQIARTALATGESWSSAYWEFMCEWFPEKKIQAEEASRAFDEMPQDEWIAKWSWALPRDAIERRIAEGPPDDLNSDKLREIAARDEWRDWHGPDRRRGPGAPGKPSASRRTRAQDRDPPGRAAARPRRSIRPPRNEPTARTCR